MKQLVVVILVLAIIAEIAWLSNAQAIPDTSTFIKSLEHQASSTARQRLAWIHRQILKNEDIQNVETWLKLGAFYDIYGYHHEATAAYHVSQQLNPQSFDAFYGYASVAVKIGVLDAAKQYFDQALTLSQNSKQRVQCLYRLGLLALREEDGDAAKVYFDKVLAINSKHWPSMYERLFLAVSENDRETFSKWYPSLAQAHYMSSETFYLNLLAREKFPDLAIEKMHEIPVRTSELYQEFNFEGERMMRVNIGISTRDLFLSDRSVEEYAVLLHKQLVDADAINRGRSVFTESNCVTCHAHDGSGQVGPNLTDDYWLHGSHLESVMQSIRDGRHNMPAHKHSLSEDQIYEVALFIIANNIQTKKAADGSSPGKAPEGKRDPVPQKP